MIWPLARELYILDVRFLSHKHKIGLENLIQPKRCDSQLPRPNVRLIGIGVVLKRFGIAPLTRRAVDVSRADATARHLKSITIALKTSLSDSYLRLNATCSALGSFGQHGQWSRMASAMH